MADRLKELLQQRALIQEHLAWLEGEISAASGRTREVPGETREPAIPPFPNSSEEVLASPVRATRVPKSPGAVTLGNSTEAEAAAMIAQLAAQEKTPPIPTKKGCWIFFCLTLVTVGLAAWAALHFFYRD